MTKEEIEKGVKLLCNTSVEVAEYIEDDQKLVDALNSVEKEHLQKCMEYYDSKSGIVIDMRKEVIGKLLDGEVFSVESLNGLIDAHRVGNEKQLKSYKGNFSVVFPAITFYGHNPQRDFVIALYKKIISDLDLEDNVKV